MKMQPEHNYLMESYCFSSLEERGPGDPGLQPGAVVEWQAAVGGQH